MASHTSIGNIPLNNRSTKRCVCHNRYPTTATATATTSKTYKQRSKRKSEEYKQLKMSEFAFFRFMSLSLLNLEEQQHKDEIVSFTEQVLDAKGIECDSKIAKISEEKLREILEQVRKLRRRKKIEEENERQRQEEELDISVQ